MSERVAILVIHGIGQQQPYETLDRFTRNLMESLRNAGKPWTLRPKLDQVPDPTRVSKGWTRASFQITPPADLPPQAFASDSASTIESVSLFEYYWAPVTQDKISYKGSLYFLIRAGLQPFLYLASNVTAIAKATEEAERRRGTDPVNAKKKARSAAASRIPYIIFKEFWRQASLFVPLLLLFIALLYWLQKATFKVLQGQLQFDGALVTLLLILAIRYLYLYSISRALIGSVKSKEGWETSSLWKLLLASGLLFHLFAIPFLFAPVLRWFITLGTGLGHCCPFLPALLGHWANPISSFASRINFPCGAPIKQQLLAFLLLDPGLYQYLWQFLTVLLALCVRTILINYVGDVAVYANASQFSKSYAVRSQIIDECSAAMAHILRSGYDRVIIAAHSLGSVIAYDTMNNLLNMARSPVAGGLQPADLKCLRGLITFGCPLNKIYYFFREQGDRKLELRDQTLQLLYGFRNAIPPEFDLPLTFDFKGVPATWAEAENALDHRFRWVNVYSMEDPISGRIVFYRVDQQERFEYLIPFVAHVAYWEDHRFYSFFRQQLL